MRISDLGEKIGKIVNSSITTEEQKLAIQREFYGLMMAELDWDKQKSDYSKKVDEVLAKIPVETKVEESFEEVVPKNKGVRAVIKEEENEEESYEVPGSE